jgi:hypothetical protein
MLAGKILKDGHHWTAYWSKERSTFILETKDAETFFLTDFSDLYEELA